METFWTNNNDVIMAWCYSMKWDRPLTKILKWSDTHCEIKETMLIGDLGLSRKCQHLKTLPFLVCTPRYLNLVTFSNWSLFATRAMSLNWLSLLRPPMTRKFDLVTISLHNEFWLQIGWRVLMTIKYHVISKHRHLWVLQFRLNAINIHQEKQGSQHAALWYSHGDFCWGRQCINTHRLLNSTRAIRAKPFQAFPCYS